MAVFPDRIVLKSSSDGDAAIRSAIGAGGTDEITPGEIVLGLGSGFASFYTLDSIGNVVEIVSGGNVSVAGVSQVNYFTGDVVLAGSDLSDIRYNGDPLFEYVTFFLPGYGVEGEEPTEVYGSTPGSAGLSTNVECVFSPVNSYGSSTKISNGGYSRQGNQLSLGTDTWAIEFKINVPDPSSDIYLLYDGVDESVDKSFFFWWDSANSQFKFEYYDSDSTTLKTFTFATTLNANTWTYLELLRSSNDRILLYVHDEITGSRSSGGSTILSTTTVGARTAGVWNIGAVTLNGTVDRASTFFLQDFRITRGALRGTSVPIPESQWGPSTFKNNGYIQVEGDVLRWNSADETWNPAGNYGRAIVSDSTPTADPSGAALLEGQSWYDFSTGNYYVYYNSGWVSAGGGGGGTLGGLTDVDLSTPATDGQVIAYNATSGNWEPVDTSGGGSAILGRGDGGDIDSTTVDSAFVFGVWGGGDLDTTTEDKPVELVVIGMADGGDIV